MKFPFVSRERFEAAEAERLRLLELLLGGAPRGAQNRIATLTEETLPPQPGTVRAVPRVESGTDSGAAEMDSAAPEPFTTPFDRLDRRFAAAQGKGKIPAEFRARLG